MAASLSRLPRQIHCIYVVVTWLEMEDGKIPMFHIIYLAQIALTNLTLI